MAMTLADVQDAYNATPRKQVLFNGQPVDLIKVMSADRIIVSSRTRASGDPATLEQLSPLP